MHAEDFLDKKWYGGLYHLYNTNDTWKQWINEFEPFYQYPSDFKEKIEKIFKSNLSYIQNKNVIDLACNLGYFGLAASNLGAKKVLGIEIRQEYIDVFQKVYTEWPKKNIIVELGNLEIQKNYSVWLNDVDTILYTGHLYHTMNHDMIFKEFTNSKAKCLIIESTIFDPSPHYESTLDPLNGYINSDTTSIEVRSPSIEETKNLLTNLGWNIKEISVIESYNPKRFVMTAIRT